MKKRVCFNSIVMAAIFFTGFFQLQGLTAAGMGDIEGFVYDKDGKTPVPYANITLTNLKTKKTYTAVTNGFGVYRFKNLPDNVYAVEIKTAKQVFIVTDPLLVSPNETRILSYSLLDNMAKRKKNRKSFLSSPMGIAVLTAGTATTGYLGWDLLKNEEQNSPYIK